MYICMYPELAIYLLATANIQICMHDAINFQLFYAIQLHRYEIDM